MNTAESTSVTLVISTPRRLPASTLHHAATFPAPYPEGVAACATPSGTHLTQWFAGLEQRLGLLRLNLLVAVLHVAIPVTGLELQIEGQAVGAAERLKTLKGEKRGVD